MFEIKQSEIYGLGCFTKVHIRKNKKIGAYAGEVISGKRRINARVKEQYHQHGVIKVIWLGDNVAIDGAAGGDATSYINHSCEPNAFMRGAGRSKVLFFALRDIAAGEEITIDYRDPEHPPAGQCRCGSTFCRTKRSEQ